jgi:ribosomal protein S12 methylthiotransferase accessory factor
MDEANVIAGRHYARQLSASTLSLGELLEALKKPVSRFKKPMRLRDRLLFAMLSIPIGRSLLGSLRVPLTSQTPIEWQPILNFLCHKKALAVPGIGFARFRYDKPKALSVSIVGKARENSAETAHVAKGHATGKDLDEVISRAIGEFLERYAGINFQQSTFISASIGELKKKHQRFLNPRDLPQFSSKQKSRFTSMRYTEDTKFKWMRNTDLVSGETALIPAQRIHYNLIDTYRESFLLPCTTNGLAGHFTRPEAIISGLKELIQRDAFLIYWLNTMTPRKIAVEECDDEELQEILAYVARYNTELHFLDLKTDMSVSTVLCVAVSYETDRPIISIGAGNGSSAVDAIKKSYYETLYGLSHGDEQLPVIDFSDGQYEPFTHAEIGQNERILLWRGIEWLERCAFLLRGESISFVEFAQRFTKYTSPEAELEALTKEFRERGRGYEIYVYEFNNKLLTELEYRVVQVTVPELIPMYLHEHHAPLDAKRLHSIPEFLGYRETKLNVYPHPFP